LNYFVNTIGITYLTYILLLNRH